MTLWITRGLPASGKTTWARARVAGDPERVARVNRDDIRQMLNEGYFVKGVTEERVLAIRDAAITALLERDLDVVCDDTNLPNRNVRQLQKLATQAGHDWHVIDLTDVPLETCIERDAARDRPVGADIIRSQYERFLKGRELTTPEPPEVFSPEPFEHDPWLPGVYIVDMDGTLALMGDRSPYDETRVLEDERNEDVATAVEELHAAGARIIVMSARTEGCRGDTAKWLEYNTSITPIKLLMRPSGDDRKDAVVKSALFDRHVRGQYNVWGVFDDRRQVVDMWRAMGLTVFHVADGEF